jgi:hypothetical protein
MNDEVGSEFPTDWETLSKRLIAAMQLGVRIEQDSGHRWIQVDGSADKCPSVLHDIRSKEYGSYVSALDKVDAVLKHNDEPSLLETFDNMKPYHDLGFVFGSGTQ